MIRVCTGWSPAGRIQYGERFLASFHHYWPREVELQVYVEEPHPMPREACRSLWDCPGAREFIERHRHNLELAGRQPRAGWKDKDRAKGYSFRFDALKFFKQILIPRQAAKGLTEGDILIWLDGDVETTDYVGAALFEEMLGQDEVAFLNRWPKHSEIGFWGVRINDRTLRFLDAIADQYTSDAFLQLREWHSAFVWDHCRRAAGLAEYHLCRPGLSGHVWPNTVLAQWLRHDKGDRKRR